MLRKNGHFSKLGDECVDDEHCFVIKRNQYCFTREKKILEYNAIKTPHDFIACLIGKKIGLQGVKYAFSLEDNVAVNFDAIDKPKGIKPKKPIDFCDYRFVAEFSLPRDEIETLLDSLKTSWHGTLFENHDARKTVRKTLEKHLVSVSVDVLNATTKEWERYEYLTNRFHFIKNTLQR